MNPVPIVQTTSRGLFSSLWLVALAILRRWKLILILFALIILFANGLKESYEQRTPEPLIREVSSVLVDADSSLYFKVQEYKSEKDLSIWTNIKFISSIFSIIIIISGVWYVFYRLSLSFNDSAKLQSYVIATIIVYLIFMNGCLFNETFVNSKSECFVPARGIQSLFSLDYTSYVDYAKNVLDVEEVDLSEENKFNATGRNESYNASINGWFEVITVW